MEPARGLQLDPVCRSKWSAAWSRISSKASRRSIRVWPSAVRRSSSTDLTSLPSCSLWLAALRLLVVVEFAFDPVGGAVEEIDGRPEQIFEVGFEARVVPAWRSGRRKYRRWRRRRDCLRAGAGDQVRRRRDDSRRAEALAGHGRSGRSCGEVRKSSCSLMGCSVDWTAPVAAFWRRKPAGGTDLHPEQSAGPKRQRRMAKAGDFASRCKGAHAPAENRRPQPLPVRTVCRPIAPLEGRGAVSLDGWTHPERHSDGVAHRASPISGYAARLMKRATSSGASCTRTLARSASMPKARRSSLKSPSIGDSAIASIPASFARSIRLSRAPSPAGSLSQAI